MDLNSKKLILVSAAVLFILLPLILRSLQGAPLIYSHESYENLEIAEKSSSTSLYPYLLSLAVPSVASEVVIGLTVLISLLSAWLFYSSLKHFGMDEETSMIAGFIYILSPLYAYTATTLNSGSIALLVTTSFLYTYSKTRHWSSYIITLPLAILSPILFGSLLIASLIYSYYQKENYLPAITALVGGSLLTNFSNLLPWNYSWPFIETLPYLGRYVTDLGALKGYPFFTLLLGFIGLFIVWSKKGYNLSSFFFLLLLGISSFTPDLRILVNLFLSIYAAFLVKHLLERNWSFKRLKQVTLLIVVLSLLFSSLSFANRAVEMPPNKGTMSDLDSIKASDKEGEILTSETKSDLVSYYVDRELWEGKDNYKKIIQEKSPSMIKGWFKANNISHIYLSRPIIPDWMEEDNETLKVSDENHPVYFFTN